MQTVSIGIRQPNGEFDILATLNNKGHQLSDTAFAELVQELTITLANHAGHVEALEREDVPDCVNLDADTW